MAHLARLNAKYPVDFMWNPADFMESDGFHGHEIWWISWWNLADFMVMKSGRFHGGIRQISWWWNLADFMVESDGLHA